MPTKLQLHLAKIFLKIFLRDRQSIFFSLFFPIIFMTVFAFANNGEVDPIKLGIVNNSASEIASDFSQMLNDNPLFTVTEGEESNLRTELGKGDQTMVLILPEDFDA